MRDERLESLPENYKQEIKETEKMANRFMNPFTLWRCKESLNRYVKVLQFVYDKDVFPDGCIWHVGMSGQICQKTIQGFLDAYDEIRPQEDVLMRLVETTLLGFESVSNKLFDIENRIDNLECDEEAME